MVLSLHFTSLYFALFPLTDIFSTNIIIIFQTTKMERFLSYQLSNRCKRACVFFVFTQLKNPFIFRRARILTFVNISHLELCKYQKNAGAFKSITELIAQKARTLWGNVHSRTKLFNMLNIPRWCHEWRKSQNSTPRTWGISWRQQSRVTLSSADSSSVRRALRNNDGNSNEVIWNLHI